MSKLELLIFLTSSVEIKSDHCGTNDLSYLYVTSFVSKFERRGLLAVLQYMSSLFHRFSKNSCTLIYIGLLSDDDLFATSRIYDFSRSRMRTRWSFACRFGCFRWTSSYAIRSYSTGHTTSFSVLSFSERLCVRRCRVATSFAVDNGEASAVAKISKVSKRRDFLVPPTLEPHCSLFFCYTSMKNVAKRHMQRSQTAYAT